MEDCNNKLSKPSAGYQKLKIIILSFHLIVVAGLISNVLAQVPQNMISGTAYDVSSRTPLAGVQVLLKDTDPLMGAVTDEAGKFKIEGVPVGRYIIVAQHIGYRTFSDEVLLKAGSQPVLNIALESSTMELEEVVIAELPFSVKEGINKRTVTIEQTTRFAANYLDPARVMTSFPGVVVHNDQNNNLVVNGKSPNGIQWRVEGFDVVNPNHLSNSGTLSDQPTQAGGGVNILSTQMLGKTTFVGLPFSAEYGNAYSGVMDMSFRNGNKSEKKYTAQASLIGLDFAAEGPLKKEKSSFLANYRYSTVGLLTQLGVDFGGEEISYQDLSFNMDFSHDSGGSLSVFAFGGLSDNDFYGVEDPKLWEVDKDSTEVLFSSSVGAIGFKDVRNLRESSSISFGSVISSARNERVANGINRDMSIVSAEDYEAVNTLISSRVDFDHKLSGSASITIGLMSNLYLNQLHIEDVSGSTQPLIDADYEGILWQPYMQYEVLIGPRTDVDGGIRYMYYTFNKTDVILPNLSLKHHLNATSSLQLSYGRQGQIQNPEVYLSGNSDLEFTTIDHTGIGYMKVFGNALLASELFYQEMDDIPANGSYAVINDLNSFEKVPLENVGSATFYGVNLSYEKPFENNIYYLLSGSLYDATYEAEDGIERDTRYNGNYSFSATAGKEWRKEKKENAVRFTGVDTRLLYAGGIRSAEINRGLSQSAGRTVFDLQDGYNLQLGNYFRIDLRISWRKDKPEYTRILAIDIQNLLSIENDGYRYFDFRQDKILTTKQLGIIPVIIYRIEF